MNGHFDLSGLPLGMQVSNRGHGEALLSICTFSLGLVEVSSRMKGKHQTAMFSFAGFKPLRGAASHSVTVNCNTEENRPPFPFFL